MWKFLFMLLAVFSAQANAQSFKTTVVPLAGENLIKPCEYEITLPSGNPPIRAVLVIFDRGRDIMKYYSDSKVKSLARRRQMAIMMPHQCPAKDAPGGPNEMDMDPSHGIARALFNALTQFSAQAAHPELSSAKLVLLGFSGTGALFAHLVGYSPDRVVAAILANPGHYDPVGIDNVNLGPIATRVPELILAGGADKVVGTKKPYDYFRLYWDQGAPWAFLAQNKTPHCCIINAKSVVLMWLEAIIEQRNPSPSEALCAVDASAGWLGFISTCPSTVHDTWGNLTWDVCDASIGPRGQAAPLNQIPAGWFPSQRTARAWLAFVKNPRHPVTSLP